MANNKIIYGIDLGTTNSAIAKFENGQAVIKKSSVQGDTTPSCVYITPKGRYVVGQKAYAQLGKDLALKFTKSNYESNTFVEFKRIMGTDETVHSSNLEKMGLDANLTPEQLSSQVLSTLRSYILDEDVKEAVITVPALFNNNQKDATKKAAELAGFDHFELIQEPVAASVAYGLNSTMKNAYWLVFDIGGGTFDAALMKIEDGIMKAVDTAGDNHLGGKDIDNAFIEQIIIPYLSENYSIDQCSSTDIFKYMWKSKAEEAKIALSFHESYDLQTDLGEELGFDDNGSELELDLTISRNNFEPVARPIFQKAIDITKQLLQRNNLSGSDLGALILIGGPTHTPLLRRMLKEQITPNVDTSIDPMTAVACGAALYGSTIDIPEEILDEKRDRSKVQLEIAVKSASVEDFEYAAVKFLRDKSDSYDGSSVFVDFSRADGLFTTGKIEITEQGDAIELGLKANTTNVFQILCYDSLGNKIECEPSSISIIHGIDGIGDAVLPLHLGIATADSDDDVVFTALEGLKKNMPLPGYGKNGKIQLCTDKDIRPGMSTDKIVIPILQTNQDMDQLKREHKKLKMLYCTHLYDLVITGDDVPSLLPAGSEINITAHAEKSGTLDSFVIDIPYLGIDLDIISRMNSVRAKDADNDVYRAEINDSRRKLQELDNSQLAQQLDEAESEFNAADNRDKKDQALESLKDILSKIDSEYTLGDWQRMENKLRGMYRELVEDNQKYGNEKTTAVIQQLKNDVERVAEAKDMEAAEELYDAMWNLDYKLAEVEFYIAWIIRWNRNFSQKKWSNPTRARSLVNQGMQIINSGNPTAEELRPIAFELSDMLPRSEKPQNDGILRQKN